MDVVSLNQFGVEGVCATLGTALTAEQARLLRRFAPSVYLGYDGDSAGQHAILRGLEIMEQEGIPVRVLDFPDGLDPDEFIRRDGLEGFKRLPAISPAVYRLRRLKEQHDLSSRDGRISYSRAAAGIIRSLDPVERETCLRDLAVETGFSREILLEQMELNIGKEPPAREPGIPKKAVSLHRTGENTAPPDVSAQETLLGLLATGQIPKDMISEKDFDDDELKSIYAGLISGKTPAALVDTAPDDETHSRYVRILLSPVADSTDQLISMANQCLARIRKSALQKKYNTLMSQIGSLPPDDSSVPALLKEAQDVQAKLRLI